MVIRRHRLGEKRQARISVSKLEVPKHLLEGSVFIDYEDDVANSPRHLHHQGNPYLRSDAWGPRVWKRRSELDAFPRAYVAESPCSSEAVRDAGRFLRQRRGQRRGLELEHCRAD